MPIKDRTGMSKEEKYVYYDELRREATEKTDQLENLLVELREIANMMKWGKDECPLKMNHPGLSMALEECGTHWECPFCGQEFCEL